MLTKLKSSMRLKRSVETKSNPFVNTRPKNVDAFNAYMREPVKDLAALAQAPNQTAKVQEAAVDAMSNYLKTNAKDYKVGSADIDLFKEIASNKSLPPEVTARAEAELKRVAPQAPVTTAAAAPAIPEYKPVYNPSAPVSLEDGQKQFKALDINRLREPEDMIKKLDDASKIQYSEAALDPKNAEVYHENVDRQLHSIAGVIAQSKDVKVQEKSGRSFWNFCPCQCSRRRHKCQSTKYACAYCERSRVIRSGSKTSC